MATARKMALFRQVCRSSSSIRCSNSSSLSLIASLLGSIDANKQYGRQHGSGDYVVIEVQGDSEQHGIPLRQQLTRCTAWVG
jgi:hypothetical protein